jgi:hypothetical protein
MTLRERLFETDPYAGFPAGDFAPDQRGFNLPAKALGLVGELKPSRIIEVGIWKGASTFFVADMLRGLGVDFEIVCVDTWLGSREMWMPGERDFFGRHKGLALEHGYPTVYHQFLANVIAKGYERQIVPFPVPSSIAYRILHDLDYRAQFVYVDGSHDLEDALLDVFNYWRLVEPGGILCGDDYGPYWPGVGHAVDRLVARTGCTLERAPEEYSWWIRKP